MIAWSLPLCFAIIKHNVDRWGDILYKHKPLLYFVFTKKRRRWIIKESKWHKSDGKLAGMSGRSMLVCAGPSLFQSFFAATQRRRRSRLFRCKGMLRANLLLV